VLLGVPVERHHSVSVLPQGLSRLPVSLLLAPLLELPAFALRLCLGWGVGHDPQLGLGPPVCWVRGSCSSTLRTSWGPLSSTVVRWPPARRCAAPPQIPGARPRSPAGGRSSPGRAGPVARQPSSAQTPGNLVPPPLPPYGCPLGPTSYTTCRPSNAVSAKPPQRAGHCSFRRATVAADAGASSPSSPRRAKLKSPSASPCRYSSGNSSETALVCRANRGRILSRPAHGCPSGTSSAQ